LEDKVKGGERREKRKGREDSGWGIRPDRVCGKIVAPAFIRGIARLAGGSMGPYPPATMRLTLMRNF